MAERRSLLLSLRASCRAGFHVFLTGLRVITDTPAHSLPGRRFFLNDPLGTQGRNRRRFILRLFILEAGIQGLAGAGMGALIGAVFSMLNGWLRFGFQSLTMISPGGLALSILVATAVGCLLSLLGVFYPALIAARMQPVEAMRVEQ